MKHDNTQHKVKEIAELACLLEPVRASGKKVVQCHGVFDLLHIGHIRHFEEAKGFGDVLVVTLTTDQHVNKGPNRPVFNEGLRAEAISALDCVDYVAINRQPMAMEAIGLLRPDFYVKGSDYRDADKDRTGGIALEEAAVTSVGGQIVYTDDIVFSSTNLINRNLPVFSESVSRYLADFSGRYSSDDIVRYLEGAASMKVLVVGETIIDEYLYCETLGKSGKEPILATRQVGREKFAGGIVPVANNVAAFCDQVTMLTFLGRPDSQEDFIRQAADPKLDQVYLYMEENAPTIVKQRFVEAYPQQKLFELYLMDDGEPNPKQVEELCTRLYELAPQYDLVIVADYGHGMLEAEAVEVLCSRARFLAINTQVNAGNRGFNIVSKYGHADFICVSENEIRLEARSRRKELREIVLDVGSRLSCGHIVITRGHDGCLAYTEKEGFFDVPAFAGDVVDRVGAGDAVFSLASLCVAQGAPAEVVGFVGNAVGAEAVATVGHRSGIQRIPLFRHIESLLK